MLIFTPLNVSAAEVTYEEASEYANSQYKLFCKASDEYDDIVFDMDNVELGAGQHVYEVDTIQQRAVFVFPVMQDKKCKALFKVTKTIDGWCGSLYQNDTKEIGKIICAKQKYIMYEVSGCQYLETENEIYLLDDSLSSNMISSREQEFLAKNFSEKCESISRIKKYINYHEISNTQSFSDDSNLIKMGYTPGLTVNTGSKVTCSVSGYMASQGDLPICWAACVASTYNYYKGKSITAKNVCDKLNVKYKAADNATTLKAFKKYGFDYKNIYAKYPNISNINACLRDHYLITLKLGTLNNDNIHLNAHDILVTGTCYKNGKSLVRIYNPQGNGKLSWTSFIGENTVFLDTWGWKSSFIPSDHKPDNY